MKIKLKLKNHISQEECKSILGELYSIYIGGYLEFTREDDEELLLDFFIKYYHLLPYIDSRRIKQEK